MLRDNWPQLTFAGLVVLAVVAAVATIGGPAQGRIEKRDAARLDGLAQLKKLVICKAEQQTGEIPQYVEVDATCGAFVHPQVSIVAFDAEFSFSKKSKTTFEVCTTFEDPTTLKDNRYNRHDLNYDTGCELVSIKQ